MSSCIQKGNSQFYSDGFDVNLARELVVMSTLTNMVIRK